MSKRHVNGYMICAVRKADNHDGNFIAPLAYGSGDQIGVDMLLMDRGAEVFATEDDALEELRATLKAVKADGHTWTDQFYFRFVPVYINSMKCNP